MLFLGDMIIFINSLAQGMCQLFASPKWNCNRVGMYHVVYVNDWVGFGVRYYFC